MPEELKNRKLEKDAIAMYSHKTTAIKWQDKKPVTILTTLTWWTQERQKSGKTKNLLPF
jgi:hypothetical protein